MKNLFLSLIIISAGMKYGPTGYSTEKYTSSSNSCSSSKNCTTTTTNNLNVKDVVRPVLGILIQTMPYENRLSFGIGYYFDSTATMNLGLAL